MSGQTVGIYVRVSRKGDREDDRFHSPREQAERASGLAVSKGYAPGPVFEDIDVSGAADPTKRPGMAELLARIDSGELVGVSAFSLDRLSREPAHGDALVKRITKRGGVILTPDIPDAIDSPTGEFTFGMLLQVAKLYRSQAKARFESAKERAVRAGIPPWPTPPFGYRAKADRTLEVDPKLGPVVREMFEMRAAGTPWPTIRDVLEEATGRKWSRAAPRRIVTNRIYATGRLQHGDTVSDVECGAIVDEPLWHAAQLEYAGQRAKREPESRWLLTGLARCGQCGYALDSWKGASRRKTRRGEWVAVPNPPTRYRCINGCSLSVDAPRLEEWVTRVTFETGDELEQLASTPDLTALQEALTSTERRLTQVLAPEAQDALGDDWASTTKARRKERDAAALELGQAQRDTGVAARNLRLRDVWDDLSVNARRDALGLYWKSIHVGRKRTEGGTPLRFVARGPLAGVEMELPNSEEVAR
jgi:DNA invertase Pin-like site-specific DNA recombinase